MQPLLGLKLSYACIEVRVGGHRLIELYQIECKKSVGHNQLTVQLYLKSVCLWSLESMSIIDMYTWSVS